MNSRQTGTLLLGGVGTYATWSDQASLNARNVSTGVLTLSAASTQGWFYDGGVTTVATTGWLTGEQRIWAVGTAVVLLLGYTAAMFTGAAVERARKRSTGAGIATTEKERDHATA